MKLEDWQREELQHRFLAKCKDPENMGDKYHCVEWTGGSGFMFTNIRQPRLPPRAAYILFGDTAPRKRLYNTCGNSKCCNWRHFSTRKPGTRALRAVAKLRATDESEIAEGTTE